MAMGEFDLITEYFAACTPARKDISLGIGDDCAIIQPQHNKRIAATMDTLVEGVHFLSGTDPEKLGYKSLAVNMSDLAAMGARPCHAMLSLTLPEADETWLAGFSLGFSRLAIERGVQLIGGDTTRGPRSISIQLQGTLPTDRAMTRGGAQADDLICVTGTLGDAALALQLLKQSLQPDSYLMDRLDCPTPRIEAGLALLDFATAAIDVSDGLAADLGHVLDASGVGADVDLDRLPLSDSFRAVMENGNDLLLAVTGGDDYELCFTLPEIYQSEIVKLSTKLNLPITAIGRISAEPGLRLIGQEGQVKLSSVAGFNHFS